MKLAMLLLLAQQTFTNPLNLDYRFMTTPPSHRTAADPLVTLYNDDYFLFASRSGGYWYSHDMRDWQLVVPRDLPIEDYAPSVITIGKRMYFTAHKLKAIWASDDPKSGAWFKVADIAEYSDPNLFRDDDGRVYLYYGSSLNGAIRVVELDPAHHFAVINGPSEVLRANYADHGWERSGPFNVGAPRMAEGYRIGPYIEGNWMTKYKGVYYLQYAAPGTIWKTYADGVYTATSPLGPFTYASYSPFSYKPGGFIGGAGHSATFQDRDGHWWHITTMVISVLQKFERRLGLFPAAFDADGVLRTNTYLGDYPQFLPGMHPRGRVHDPIDDNLVGWMVLPGIATASSGARPQRAADENVMTTWSAASGAAGEWLALDLRQRARVNAVQVNFGEVETESFARDTSVYQQYDIAVSDGGTWRTIVSRRDRRDRPHDYIELDTAVFARYVRVRNVHAAAGGKFAIRDLRVFGRAPGKLPLAPRGLSVRRDPTDGRNALLTWRPQPGVRKHVVRYGIAPTKLYSSYEIDDSATLDLRSLNRDVSYYFAVDAVNDVGVTRGKELIASVPQTPLTLALWPDHDAVQPRVIEQAPDSVRGAITRITDVRNPSLTVYRPQTSNGRGVLVFPGGGYQHLSIDIEGTEPCRWLTNNGYTCILVQYSVPQPRDPGTRFVEPLRDAREAMRLARQHAREWRIDAQHIGALGFSAGAHLVALLSTGELQYRPAFALLIYPAYIADLKPGAHAPPTFLAQTRDDPVGVRNSESYAAGLRAAGVSTSLHVFEKGGHGYGMRQDVNSTAAAWPALAMRWLHQLWRE